MPAWNLIQTTFLHCIIKIRCLVICRVRLCGLASIPMDWAHGYLGNPVPTLAQACSEQLGLGPCLGAPSPASSPGFCLLSSRAAPEKCQAQGQGWGVGRGEIRNPLWDIRLSFSTGVSHLIWASEVGRGLVLRPALYSKETSLRRSLPTTHVNREGDRAMQKGSVQELSKVERLVQVNKDTDEAVSGNAVASFFLQWHHSPS